MKIKHLLIHKYLQFKNFNLPLIYPNGHEKAGQPLDKICFIGQSGTGKTSLLNLIKTIISHDLIDFNYITPAMEHIWAQTVAIDNETHKNMTLDKGTVSWEIKQKANKNFMRLTDKKLKAFLTQYYQDSNVLVSFPAEMNVNLETIFLPNLRAGLTLTKETASITGVNSINLQFFDFEQNNIESVWNLILDDIQKYKINHLRKNNELSNQLAHGTPDIEKILLAFQQWKAAHPNPIKAFADKLNPMLNRFNLEIKPEFDFKTADDLRFIQIHQKHTMTEIPNTGWSTGTKQLIMTATPLLKLNTDKAVILIDEPERSFYPDIQRDLIGFYRQLAPNAQLFVATHSPIIAAAFDPWEIIELKFDEQGFIMQDLYYEGEHHVDNYRIHPKYLRWDAVLLFISIKIGYGLIFL
jgi:predicted ATP-dependent endonuclease of OLD family